MKWEDLIKLLEIENLLKFIQTNLIKIIITIVLFKVVKYLKKSVDKFVKNVLLNSKMDQSVATFLSSIFSIFYYVIFVYMILGFFNVNLSAIATYMGAMGLILGLAFKETLQNFCGGIIILTFKPFKVGDLVEYKEYVGTVKSVELFYTRILNPQNELVIIPNGIITNTELRNITREEIRRLDLIVGVSYDSNIEKVKNSLNKVIFQMQVEKVDVDEDGEGGEPLILSEEGKDITVGIDQLGESSINFTILVYVKSSNYLKTKLLLNERILEEFRKEGIEIPYPHLVVKTQADLVNNKK